MTGRSPSALPVPREARAYQGKRAGMVSRLVASVIDGFVVVVILVFCYLGVNGLLFVLDPIGFELVTADYLVSAVLAMAVAMVYLACGWAAAGRTYGCHVMGLRIVDQRGLPPRIVVATTRAALCVVFPVGLLWCTVGRSRRSVQDLIVRTHVVYDWLPRHEEGRGF